MLRTTWFAFVCVAILCTAAAIRIAMTPVSPAVATAQAQTAMDDAVGPNTAAKSDRLYIPGKVQPTDSDPVRPVVKTVHVEASPEPPDTTREALNGPLPKTDDKPTEKKTAQRRWQDANAKLVDDPPRRRTKAKPKATNAANDRTTTTSDQGKTTNHTFQCRRDGFGSLLRSLDLSPSCS